MATVNQIRNYYLWSPRCHILGRGSCKIIFILRKKNFWVFQSLVTYVLLNNWLCSRNQECLISPSFWNSDAFLLLPAPHPTSAYLNCPLKGRSVLWIVRTMWEGLRPGRILCAMFPSFLKEQSSSTQINIPNLVSSLLKVAGNFSA